VTDIASDHPHADDPLLNLRIGDVLRSHAGAHPRRPAVRYEERDTTYADLLDRVERCSRALLAMGLAPGDRVAVLSTPRPEALVTFLATAYIGALWVGLNPRYQLPEMEYVVADARPRVLLGIDRLEARTYAAELRALRRGGHGIEFFVGFDGGEGYDLSFEDWMANGVSRIPADALDVAAQAVRSTAPALLVYTSGSSGRPKGVLLRHRELLRRSRTQNERFTCRDFPRLINPLPINHIGGMHFLTLYALVGGGTITFQTAFDTDGFKRALETGEINILITLPTMFKQLADRPDFRPELLDGLDWFVFSGAAMSPELLALLGRARCRVGLTYGMTETCGSVTYSEPDADADVLANTIGKPHPAGEVRVADDQGHPCAPDIPGELQVRPDFCMEGYFNRPEATTAAYTVDGWLRTGDVAILRTDGNIRFVGRRSEMFKSGGYNVYPREVELAIERLETVRLSAVVGVPDPLYDEVGWAYVVPTPGARIDELELKAWLRNQLANYKVPKRVFVCDDLPLLPIGKVDKVMLKAQATARQRASARDE
jgi:acyl-CoA synthetase (AMP-forming)/AMP-acid ligase II